MQKNRIVGTTLLVVVLLAGLLVQAASAGNFHFKNLTFSLGSLVARGTLVGLGNEAAEVTLTAYGKVRAMCQNNGGQQAPGRNPIFVDTQETQTYVTASNGQAQVVLRAPDPVFADVRPSPTPKQAGCPNGNWKVTGLVDEPVYWTRAEVVVKDESGQVLIALSYNCTTTYVNGAGSVSCTEE